MDRRQALQALTIGSGAAIGASAIVSSPAFAYSTPTLVSGPTILTPDTIGDERVDVDSGSFGTATCPGPANSSPVIGQFVRWDAVIGSNLDGASIQHRNYNGGGVNGHLNGSPPDSRGFRLRKRAVMDTSGSAGGDIPWRAGDSFIITLVARYTCVYSDNTARSIEASTTITMTKGSAGTGDDWAVSARSAAI